MYTTSMSTASGKRQQKQGHRPPSSPKRASQFTSSRVNQDSYFRADGSSLHVKAPSGSSNSPTDTPSRGHGDSNESQPCPDNPVKHEPLTGDIAYLPLTERNLKLFQQQLNNISTHENKCEAHLITDAFVHMGVNLPDNIMEKLVGCYDGMIPLDRFIAEQAGPLNKMLKDASSGATADGEEKKEREMNIELENSKL